MGSATSAKVSGIGRTCHCETGQTTAIARPTTDETGTNPPPGSPMWARESDYASMGITFPATVHRAAEFEAMGVYIG